MRRQSNQGVLLPKKLLKTDLGCNIENWLFDVWYMSCDCDMQPSHLRPYQVCLAIRSIPPALQPVANKLGIEPQ